MKILKRILLFILVIIGLAVALLFIYLDKQAPQYKGTLEVAGVSAETEVLFDEYGIPHIYAGSAEDAYFALGYVHAQDRLFQMELIRRLISGRLSELLGPDLVETDKYFLTLGLREEAFRMKELAFSERETPIQKEAFAYMDGVNHFINTGTAPLEFTLLGIKKEPYGIEDMYSTILYMAMAFTNGFKIDLVLEEINNVYGEQYLEDWFMNYTGFHQQPVAEDTVLLSEEALSFNQSFPDLFLPVWEGSNAWALAPSRTKSGKAITANDTHIPFAQPSVWYEAHLEYPGFSFYGNYLAGVPFAPIGHNRDISWGMTIFPVDICDLYQERTNRTNPDEVWVVDHWEPVQKISKTIKVKGESDIDLVVKKTKHGPIVNDVLPGLGDTPVSFWWTLYELPNNSVKAFYDMAHASNIDDARQAAATNDILGLNIMYGDKAGNIAWWASGKMPKRPAHVNPSKFLDGASGKDELLGYYDFSENPQSENPASGILVSSNNEPDPVNDQQYPGYYLPNGRYDRIYTLLEAKNDWTIEDLKTVHGDHTSDIHKTNARKIFTVLKGVKLSEKESAVLDLLDGWTGEHGDDSKAAIVYNKFLYYMTEACFADELSPAAFEEVLMSYTYRNSIPNFIHNPDSPWWDDINTEGYQEPQHEIFVDAFRKTTENLYQGLGDDISKWRWKDINVLTHVHPIGQKKPFDKIFNVGPYHVSGGNGVPNKLEHVLSPDDHYEVKSGPALRILLDFEDVDNSLNINPTGQSGNIMSDHYEDQAEMFAQLQYRKQKMNRADIEKNARRLVFKPKGRE
jgi:penicillin amidase